MFQRVVLLLTLVGISCRGPIAHNWEASTQGIAIINLNGLQFNSFNWQPDQNDPKSSSLRDVISRNTIDTIYIIRNNTSMMDKGHLDRIMRLIDTGQSVGLVRTTPPNPLDPNQPEYFFHALFTTKSKHSIHFLLSSTSTLVAWDRNFARVEPPRSRT